MERQIREGQAGKKLNGKVKETVRGYEKGHEGASAKAGAKPVMGLTVPRYFTTPGVDPADELAWELRTAVITGEDGRVVFEQKDVEVPKTWSMLATNVVASEVLSWPDRHPRRGSGASAS